MNSVNFFFPKIKDKLIIAKKYIKSEGEIFPPRMYSRLLPIREDALGILAYSHKNLVYIAFC